MNQNIKTAGCKTETISWKMLKRRVKVRGTVYSGDNSSPYKTNISYCSFKYTVCFSCHKGSREENEIKDVSSVGSPGKKCNKAGVVFRHFNTEMLHIISLRLIYFYR